MEKIKIMIAEDQHLLRKALSAVICEEEDFEIVGEANNGKELLELIKRQEPSVVLLDIDMPLMNGWETLAIIKKRFLNVKVIMLTMHSEPGFINEFMTHGANAYLTKGVDIVVLFDAIRAVHKEGLYFSKEVSNALLQGLQQEKAIHPVFDEIALTEKEMVILKELCNGSTNKEIAVRLHISHNTVDFHRGNIYTKTKSKNITDLVKYAIRHGII